MAVTTATTDSRRSNQFYEVNNVQGQNAVLLTGDKDNIIIPTDSAGLNGVYTNAEVTFRVYEGFEEVTSTWSFSLYSTFGVSVNVSSNTFTVTNISFNVGTFTVRASKQGYDSLFREIKVYKSKEGIPGNNSPFIYIAYADKQDGTGFTTTFNESKEFFAIITSPTIISPLTVSSFVGKWTPLNSYNKVCTYNNISYLPTNKAQWSANAMAQGYLGPGAFYHKGTYSRIYFCMFDYTNNASGTSRSGHANTTYVGYYDIEDMYFSGLTSIPHVYSTSTDQHDVPSIIVSDSGHIIVTKERLRAPSGSHNSPIEIWRSNSAEDISSFTNIVTISNTVGEGFSYPNLCLGPNTGEVYMFLRGNGAGDHSHLYMIKSSDNGLTWKDIEGTSNAVTKIAYCTNFIGTGLDWYFYFQLANGKRSLGLNILGVLNEGPDGTYSDGKEASSRNKVLLYLHSDDGITWENVKSQFNKGGAFSKNIVTSSSITPAELNSNFLILSHSPSNNTTSSPYTAYIDGTGIPYIFDRTYLLYDSTDNPDFTGKDNRVLDDSLWHFNLDSNSWQSNSYKEFFKDPYDIDSSMLHYSLFTTRMDATVYESGVVDVIGRRLIRKNDFYKTDYTPITSSSNAIRGGVFRIASTTANNFGEGLVAGDNFYYTSDKTINASNTLLPLETEILIIRSYDKGVTWTEIKCPIDLKEDKYASVNPSITTIANNQDGGVAGVFIGIDKALPGIPSYDHSEFYLLWDKVRI